MESRERRRKVKKVRARLSEKRTTKSHCTDTLMPLLFDLLALKQLVSRFNGGS